MRYLLFYLFVFNLTFGFCQLSKFSAPIKLKHYPNLYFITEKGNDIYSYSANYDEDENDKWVNGGNRYIIKSPKGAKASIPKEIVLPKIGSIKPRYINRIVQNGRVYILVEYFFNPDNVEIILYEISLNATVENTHKVFTLDRAFKANEFELKSNDNGLLVLYRVNKQLTYKTLDLETSKLSKEMSVFIPHLSKNMSVAFMENFSLYVITFITDALEVVTVNKGWVIKNEKVGSDKFEPFKYSWTRSGNNLFIVSFYEHIDLVGPVGISAQKFFPDKPYSTKRYYFSKEDYNQFQVDREEDEYFSMKRNFNLEAISSDNHVVVTSAIAEDGSYRQIMVFSFEKDSLNMVNKDVIIRRKGYGESTNFCMYPAKERIKGFYFDTEKSLTAKKQSELSFPLKKDKSGVMISLEHDGTRLTKKNLGKKKLIPQTNECYDEGEYVAILNKKGKSKGYWQIIRK